MTMGNFSNVAVQHLLRDFPDCVRELLINPAHIGEFNVSFNGLEGSMATFLSNSLDSMPVGCPVGCTSARWKEGTIRWDASETSFSAWTTCARLRIACFGNPASTIQAFAGILFFASLQKDRMDTISQSCGELLSLPYRCGLSDESFEPSNRIVPPRPGLDLVGV